MNTKHTHREPVVEFVRELLLEAEFDRIAALGPQQLREEFGDGDVPPRVGTGAAPQGDRTGRRWRSAGAAIERREPRRAPARTHALLLGGLRRGHGAARHRHPAPPVPPAHEETPQEKAARLRDEAYVDVQKGYLDEAWDKLLAARELDPAGDTDPRVQQAYQTIDAGSAKPMEYMSKPPIAPYERPLKRR
jgi:hypothetical protein